MIHRSGTFDYAATIPDRVGDDAAVVCHGHREGALASDRPDDDVRLVGANPIIRITDAGLTPDAGPRRPWVLRSRITLTASPRQTGRVAEMSFCVDAALTACLKAGDELHLARTGCGGLRVFINRNGQLRGAVRAHNFWTLWA